MSSLGRSLMRQSARDRGVKRHVVGPHRTRGVDYFMKAKARRRRASEIANISRRANDE